MPDDVVRPLDDIEQQFLQVLLEKFVLTRTERGAHLDVRFDGSTPAIWLRRAKHELQRRYPDFAKKSAAYQRELDAFLLEGQGPRYAFHDPNFLFRYASGGTLPIVNWLGRECYCLWYREVPPVGWNIANGGCDSRDELIDPMLTLTRELGEEMIVVETGGGQGSAFGPQCSGDPRPAPLGQHVPHEDVRRAQAAAYVSRPAPLGQTVPPGAMSPASVPPTARRYVIERGAGDEGEGSELRRAFRYWRDRRRELDFSAYPTAPLEVEWLGGPDSLAVHYGESAPTVITGCYLNINGEDFGMEIDRVARIALPADAVICDGEITHDRLVDAPVGLFPIDEFHERLRRGERCFRPAVFFFNATTYDGQSLDEVIDGPFLDNVRPILRTEDLAAFQAATSGHVRYDACPVTRRITQRHAAMLGG